MDLKLLAVLIGMVSGAVGYWFTTFSIQPILRYKNIRNQILMDFIYYAQVVNGDGLNEEMKALHRERILANRKSSAQLTAATLELPWWYSLWLQLKGQAPTEAARKLIGYSNTTNWDDAHNIEDFIRRKLGLPKET